HLKIVTTNPDMLYRPATERLGKTLHDIMPADKADPLLAAIRASLRERRTVHHDYHLPVGAEERWYWASVSPMTGASVIRVARDITARKRTEDDLQRANDALVSTVRELETNTRHAGVLNAMGELLQTCMTAEEFRSVVASYVPELFPEGAGAVYLTGAVRGEV